jgi:hypothetical protein
LVRQAVKLRGIRQLLLLRLTFLNRTAQGCTTIDNELKVVSIKAMCDIENPYQNTSPLYFE